MATMSRMRKIRIDACLVMSVCFLLTHAGAGSQGGTDPSGMTLRCAWAYASSHVDITGAVSPDGRYIAFEDKTAGDLAVRDLISGQNRLLTHNKAPGEGSLSHAEISRDSRQVAYSWRHQDGTIDLRLIGLDGSGQRVLFQHDDVIRIEPEGWSPDGKDILARITRRDGTHQIALIPTADGSMRVVKTLGSTRDGAAHLSLSPDGRFIAYDFHPTDDPSHEDIAILSIDGTTDTPLVEHPADDNVLGWSSNGKWVLFRGDRSGLDDMWAIRVTADGKPKGDPQLIKENIVGYSGRGSVRDGSFFYEAPKPSVRDADVYIATLDPETGRLAGVPQSIHKDIGGQAWGAGWSPDGEYLAYYRLSERGGQVGMVIQHVKTGRERELSPPIAVPSGRYAKAPMRWSPDGRSILRVGRYEGKNGVYVVDVETGDFTSIVEIPQRAYISHALWSPDGKAIFYHRWDEKSSHVLLRNLEDRTETELLRGDASAPIGPDFALSPDGGQLAFGSPWFPGKGVTALNVIPTVGGEPRVLFRERGSETLATFAMNIRGRGLEWTPDGRYVLFIKGDYRKRQLWRVAVEGAEPERLGLEVQSAPPPEYCVHPDGRRIAFTTFRVQDRELWVMKNFLPD